MLVINIQQTNKPRQTKTTSSLVRASGKKEILLSVSKLKDIDRVYNLPVGGDGKIQMRESALHHAKNIPSYQG